MKKRQTRKNIAAQTLDILESGQYRHPAGHMVDIGAALQRAVDSTTTYAADESLPLLGVLGPHTPSFEVTTETTFAAAQRLLNQGVGRVAALNFASAKNPGGGFANGAQAQEESLARASGLFACIRDSPMYRFHRSLRDPRCLYTDHVIHAPDVPVFRDDTDALLDAPYTVSILTSPAVNAGVARSRGVSAQVIEDTMQQRISRVLHVAWLHGDEHLVLGAWGCGVFRNDPHTVARLFKAALEVDWAGAFARVVFGIAGGGPNHTAFAEVFGQAGATCQAP